MSGLEGHDEWPAHFEVTRPRAIELLASRRILRLLNPFMRGQHTLTTAARAVGRSPSSLAYWLPTLVREGLLVHLRDDARPGRAMPVYRTPGRRFTVPFALIPFDQRIAFLDGGRVRVLHEFLDGLDEVMARAGDFSLEFAPHGEVGASIQVLEPGGVSPMREFSDAWLTLNLSTADALSLCGELEALIKKYAARESGRAHVVHIGVAPSPEHRWRSISDAR